MPRAIVLGGQREAWQPARLLAALVIVMLAHGALWLDAAHATKVIAISPDQDRLELTALGELYQSGGDTLQVDVVNADGMQARMKVPASAPGSSPRWLVFALSNPSDKPIERLLTSERYTLVGSGVVWPDLDARRIEAVTPSLGFLPERQRSDRADIFRITLEPGQTITYAVELTTASVPRIYLWKPLPYELKARDRQLFNGIMLGIVGVLGIFLTSIFAANHKGIFPAAALVAWCLLAYMCVDFGFFHKLFNLRPEDNAIYRAATESSVAASLVIFLTTFLRAHAWPGFARMLATLWIIGQLSLVAVAVVDPRLAATFARASFLAIGGLGSVLILFFFVRGQDRALALIPTWILFLVFVYGAHVTLAGRIGGDIVVSTFVASLVLLATLIGFTVTQFAFKPGDIAYGTAGSDGSLSALAVDLSRAAIWEWNAKSDDIKVGPQIEQRLGLMIGELSGKVARFASHVHPADRDRFTMQLWSAQERGRGTLAFDARMRHADNSYVWVAFEAASVAEQEGQALRCVGLVRDVSEQHRAREQLMHDAVHDTRTGLPNRVLLVDRMTVALTEAAHTPERPVVVLVLGIDKFTEHNTRFGRTVGDTLLQTAARRISRLLKKGDTLARVGGDQFGMLIRSETDITEIALLAERIRTSIQAPTNVVGEEVVLTGSLGIALSTPEVETGDALLEQAVMAMAKAKREGANRFALFTPELAAEPQALRPTTEELRVALDKSQLRIDYQPVIYLATEELVGFEASLRWEHPRLGLVLAEDILPLAEEGGLTQRLGAWMIDTASDECARWHGEYPRADKPLFVAVDVASRQLFRPGLVADVKRAIQRHRFEPGTLRLEIAEALVMENPEQAAEVLAHLKAAGAGLAMDDFGTGYSSLAYLQRFPFDVIKVDRALTGRCSEDAAGTVIVRSIVALAHELGRKVVADGVEDEMAATLLRSFGCDFGQGFHFGEPASPKDTITYLRFVKKTERKLQRRGLLRPNIERRGRIIDEAQSTKTLKGVLAKARRKATIETQPSPAARSSKPQPTVATVASVAPNAREVIRVAEPPPPIARPEPAQPPRPTAPPERVFEPVQAPAAPPVFAQSFPFVSDRLYADSSGTAGAYEASPTPAAAYVAPAPPSPLTASPPPHAMPYQTLPPRMAEAMAAPQSEPMRASHIPDRDPTPMMPLPFGPIGSIAPTIAAAPGPMMAPAFDEQPPAPARVATLTESPASPSSILPFDSLPPLTSLPSTLEPPRTFTPQIRPIRRAGAGLPPRIAQSLARLAGESVDGNDAREAPPRAAE